MSMSEFDIWLDEGSSKAWLNGKKLPLSVVLKSVDPEAYELLYLDWVNPDFTVEEWDA